MLKKILNVFLFIIITTVGGLSSAIAQSPFSSSDKSSSPIEISAEESLEWLQEKKQYVANGSVIVTQDEMTLTADKLVADYDDNQGGSLNITFLTATGSVVLKNLDSTATGNEVTYNLESEEVVLIGNTPTLITPEQTISASEKLTYNMKLGTAQAIGNAKIVTPKETLQAQKITAILSKKNDNKKQELTSAQATGGVKITTKDEIVTGALANYNAEKNTADVKGNVKIIRGLNTLEGDHAIVNLTTNVSRMFGNEKTGERVKGVFFPKSKGE